MCNLLEELVTFTSVLLLPSMSLVQRWFAFHQCAGKEGIAISEPQSFPLDALYICTCIFKPTNSYCLALKINTPKCMYIQ